MANTKREEHIQIIYFLSLVFLFLVFGCAFTFYYQFIRITSASTPSAYPYLDYFQWASMSFFGSVLLFKILIYWRKFFVFLLFPLLLLSVLSNTAAYHIGQVIEPNMVQAALYAQPAEIMAFITPLNVAIVLVGLLSLLPIHKIAKKIHRKPHDIRVAGLSAVLLGMMLLSSMNNFLIDKPPFNTISAAITVLRPGKYEPVYDNTLFTAKQHARVRTVVLVIGESARGDHMSLSGYGRNTNAYLSKRSNLIHFDDAVSCAAMTHTSVPCMITDATLKDFSEDSGTTPKWGFSLITGFQRAGFRTAWIGMQDKWVANQIPFLKLAATSDDVIFPAKDLTHHEKYYDDMVLPHLASLVHHQQKNAFIIIHLNGSHTPYELRYPKEFEKFLPTCTGKQGFSLFAATGLKECEQKYAGSVTNMYDNSLLYTDFVLDRIIKELSGTDALMIYSSDHGESLGEHGMYSHGRIQVKEQRIVPFFVWGSDEFIKNNQVMWSNIKENAQKPISHDALFHSLLHCGDVVSSRVDAGLSICAKDMKPRPEVHFSTKKENLLDFIVP